MKREIEGRVAIDVRAYEVALAPWAARSTTSRGRERPEPACGLRTEFQRDRDRILHSKAFRRLKHKTQVFIAPEGDHYRTRLTHTLEVAGVARAVARGLRLNEDLTEAIALGHDLGHTPFGHAGEDALDAILKGLGRPGFRHNEQSARVVEVLENDGLGLNLTWEVRDGIRNHTGPVLPATLEGQVVRICDRIAYVNHDLDDALRAGLITSADIPKDPEAILGRTGSERIDRLVHDLVDTSFGRPIVEQSPEVSEALNDLRTFLFQTVYARSVEVSGARRIKAVLEGLFNYFMEHPEELPHDNAERMQEDPVLRIADYIAGMTDRYAMRLYFDLFVPRSWSL